MPVVELYGVSLPENATALVDNVLKSKQLASGPKVEIFEKLLGDYIGNSNVTVNGDISTAIVLCLIQGGIVPSDEVLVSPICCLSTTCPVLNLFANIRWVDVNPHTGNMDSNDLKKKITKKSKAIIVYHWCGYPADMDSINKIAKENNLLVIEDAGESFGAIYKNRKLGSGDSNFTVFSFYANRHLTTIEGGAICCNKSQDLNRIRKLKRYGIDYSNFRSADGEINPKSDIVVAGWNSYMNNIFAAIGIEQLSGIEDQIRMRMENGEYYNRQLAGLRGVKILEIPADTRPSYWVYTFLSDSRDRMLRYLNSHGVKASKVHMRNDAYTAFGAAQGSLSGVDYFAARCISIPSGPWVNRSDQDRIIQLILNCC